MRWCYRTRRQRRLRRTTRVASHGVLDLQCVRAEDGTREQAAADRRLVVASAPATGRKRLTSLRSASSTVDMGRRVEMCAGFRDPSRDRNGSMLRQRGMDGSAGSIGPTRTADTSRIELAGLTRAGALLRRYSFTAPWTDGHESRVWLHDATIALCPRPHFLFPMAPTSASPAIPASQPLRELVICPRSGWIAIDWRELWEARELMYFPVLRDVKVRYKQTVLGVAWAVLQPLFTIVFGKFAKIPSDGLPYASVRRRSADAGFVPVPEISFLNSVHPELFHRDKEAPAGRVCTQGKGLAQR